jgi:integrase
MNVLLVAQILGHRSLRMIHLHYGHLTQADAYDKLVALIAQEEP